MNDRDLSAAEITALTSGGDCGLHSHSFDRQMTHDSLEQLQAQEKIAYPTTTYTVQAQDDYIFGDTTGGAFNVNLPIARGGKIITMVRIAGGNNMTLVPNGSDTVNGAATKVISASYSPVRLKAIKGTGWIQV